MPSYLSYKKQIAVLDGNNDDITWITVKGNHIPIKKGQNKEEAVKEFFEKKNAGSKSEKVSKTPEKQEFMSKEEFEKVYNNTKKNLAKATKEEPNITKDLKSIKGIVLHGLDFRLKQKKSAVEKVKRERQDDPRVKDISDRAIMNKMYDLVRYTQLVDKDTFVEQAQKTIDELKSRGYKIVQLKNYWRPEVNKGTNPYRGINMKWKSPDGQKFELQFNTENNLKVKDKMHDIYNKQRILKEGSKEWSDLNNESLKLTKLFDNPKNIEKLVA